MNNLDLFKILGKLFEFYKNKSTNSFKNPNSPNTSNEENQSQANANSETLGKTTTPSPVSPFGFENLLSGLFNTNKTSPQKPENKTSEITTLKRAHTPLQKGMLDTMNSHDQIVKRVQEKANLSSKAKTLR
jgi:hypothetical protein